MLTKKHFLMALHFLAGEAKAQGWSIEKCLEELEFLSRLMRDVSENPRFDQGKFIDEGKKFMGIN